MLRREAYLGQERLHKIHELLNLSDASPSSRARNISLLFNVFATATIAFVARTSNQWTVTIGTPTHNRYIAGSSDVAGLFMGLSESRNEI